MFMGEYSHNIDEKGRLIMPSKFREELGSEFVVTPGIDGCLYAYPMDEWKNTVESIREAVSTGKDARTFRRRLLSQAEKITIDKQGRFSLPPAQKDKAGLKKEVVFAGVLNKIEIWDKDAWDAIIDDGDMEELADKMAELGISI